MTTLLVRSGTWPSRPADVAGPRRLGFLTTDVYLRFTDRISDPDREDFLTRLRAVKAPDFDLLEDDDIRLRIDAADESMALVRAQELVKWLCRDTTTNHSWIRRSLGPS